MIAIVIAIILLLLIILIYTHLGIIYEGGKILSPEEKFIKRKIPIMTSERLKIKQLTIDDLDDLNKLLLTEKDVIYDCNITKEKLEYIKYFGAYLDNQLIAASGFKMVSWGYKVPRFSNIGIVMNKDYRRQGYMDEMQKTLLRYIKKHTGLREINMQIHKDNKASIEAAKKLGYELLFEKYDHYFMILKW